MTFEDKLDELLMMQAEQCAKEQAEMEKERRKMTRRKQIGER